MKRQSAINDIQSIKSVLSECFNQRQIICKLIVLTLISLRNKKITVLCLRLGILNQFKQTGTKKNVLPSFCLACWCVYRVSRHKQTNLASVFLERHTHTIYYLIKKFGHVIVTLSKNFGNLYAFTLILNIYIIIFPILRYLYILYTSQYIVCVETRFLLY